MTPFVRPPQPEILLAHTSWMRSLARRLLSDHAEADDIVQETFLAFLMRPPRSVDALGGWLGRVIRNLVLERRQAKERRERREHRAARLETISVTPGQMLEQAEMHRLLMEEVLRMDEPYRSTVLLRFFGEQSSAEIARRQGVPLDTVKTRLRRAMEQLRGRLDHAYGGRETWTLGLLPLAGLAALSTPTAGAPAATACAAALGSSGGTSSAATVAGISLGGLLVAKKTALVVGLVGVITLACGFGLGRSSKPNSEDARADLDLARAGLKKDIAALRAEKESLAAAKAGLEEERIELARKAAAIGEQAREPEAKAAVIEKPVARRGPRLTFWDMGELEEDLIGADWPEMAEGIANLTSMLEEMSQSDTEPTRDQQIEVRLEEQKLMSLAIKMSNKLPSHDKDGNGGFTHPIIHWNLLAERLEMAGSPLSEDQVERMSRLGIEYDTAWERQEAGYGADTLTFEKIMNELELKRTCNERLIGLLTREQREVIVDPALHDTYPYDLHSPLFLLAGKIEPIARRTKDEVRNSIEEAFGEHYGLSEEEKRAAAPAFDAWFGQVEPLLATPLRSFAMHRVYFMSGVEALAAGRAQTSLMREVLALLPGDEGAREKLLNASRFYLPRLVEKKAKD